jgi:hypothetical protein
MSARSLHLSVVRSFGQVSGTAMLAIKMQAMLPLREMVQERVASRV